MSDAPKQSKVEISGFDLQRRLGAGGMAEVFLAKKRGAEGTYKQLVVKRILPEHSASRRFRHMFVEEAHLATRLNHPNIVQVYDFFHSDDDLLLSMEYVEGVDLGKLKRAARKTKKTLPFWVSAFIAGEVAKGLHYAHERKDEVGLPLDIVHRDVSPQNVLISLGGIVKIADFGIATANLFREEAGVLKGKFSYMSPEQARAEKVDRRSDIYALGVVLYELLAGQSPYGSLKEEALAEAVRYGTLKPPSTVVEDVPRKLDEITMKALARRAEDRYKTARELAAAIARALLEARQLVDNTSVEEMMAGLLALEEELEDGEEPQRTLAAVRKPRTAASESSILGTAQQSRSKRMVREVRHVAVIKLRLEGLEALQEVQSEAAVKHTLDTTRATLDDIAYKRGAVWTWDTSTSAWAVVGLMANPGRAPNDAALLAVDTHEFLASHSEDLPVQMRASVAVVRGIAAGERTDQGHLRHHSLHHPANYLAEQLGGRTPFGKTWVAGGVYRLMRREFRWRDGPAIALEDAPAPNVPDRMRVYVLLRPLTAEEQMAEMALNPNDVVGRDAEKADLHAAYHRAVHHPGLSTPPPPPSTTDPKAAAASQQKQRGELVARVIVGEMGIGKTALVDNFVSELPEEARVYRVECSPVKIDLPYATVTDVLREVTGAAQDDSFDAVVELLEKTFGAAQTSSERAGRMIPRLAELITGKEVQLLDEDAATQRHDQVVLGVRLLFGAIAADAPAVVIADGLQWADRASLEVYQAILERDEQLPVLMLLVTRPDDRVGPYLEGTMRNELGGLEPDQQIRLVQARIGVREGVAAICRELVPRVGGNPYFLLEMVDALLERGALEIIEPEDGGEAVLVRHDQRFGESADALPSTVEQLVANRLGELPPTEHDVVDWLAVAGGPLSEEDLLALTRLADDEAITRLCARGLCDHKGRSIDFRHPLARDVAYNALEPVQRARMHRRLGEHFATTALARGLSAAIVAQHLERGEAPRQAAELYMEAAQAARNAHQTQHARRYFDRTLLLLPVGDSRRMMAHEALESIYRDLGQSRERRAQLEALRRMARESRQARWIALALQRAALLHLDEASMAKGLPVAQRAADLARYAKQPDLEVEALIILCELLRDLGDVNGALDACERALEASASPRVSQRARAEVLRAKGVLLRRAGRLHGAIETHAEAIAIFRAVGARRSEARARNALGFALFVLGRYEDCA
ncbi:MAG: protein kinase, partial [Deltaproteobacteria bacterium]|nr:protein kinase [Deltaproteobacteria bacterium]